MTDNFKLIDDVMLLTENIGNHKTARICTALLFFVVFMDPQHHTCNEDSYILHTILNCYPLIFKLVIAQLFADTHMSKSTPTILTEASDKDDEQTGGRLVSSISSGRVHFPDSQITPEHAGEIVVAFDDDNKTTGEAHLGFLQY
uniref:Uncharacterized protein n=1 Tax=Romanomermis culicivorax TaxID=13658 RepID=A0A915I955_ROMCU